MPHHCLRAVPPCELVTCGLVPSRPLLAEWCAVQPAVLRGAGGQSINDIKGVTKKKKKGKKAKAGAEGDGEAGSAGHVYEKEFEFEEARRAVSSAPPPPSPCLFLPRFTQKRAPMHHRMGCA